MASIAKMMKSIPFYYMSVLRKEASRSEKYLMNFNPCRFYSGAYEAEGKTHAVVLNQDFGAPLMIDSYSEMGFRMNNGLSFIGPIAIFPNTVLSWDVADITGINEESLSLFWLLEPKVDVLVIGIGGKDEVKDPAMFKIISMVRKYKIAMEVLPTESACAVFNFLNADRRFVGGALLPPKFVIGGGETLIENQEKSYIATPANMKID